MKHFCIFKQVLPQFGENLSCKYGKGAITTVTTDKKNNIVLVGFMGSGKTVIGRNVARILDYDFADTDDHIREVTGMELNQLLRKHGQIRFRSEEKLACTKLANRQHQVIACGGNLMPEKDCLDMLAKDGFIVLLTAAPEIIMARLSRKNDKIFPGGRPTLTDIEEMLRQRQEYFEEAGYISVDTGKMGVEEAAEYIAKKYKEHLAEA